MTWHQKQISSTNILPPFPQHRTPYSLKYFLDFIGDLFIPPLSIESLDVYYVLLSLNPNKSKGFDNLPNRLLKNCAQSLATPFSLLFPTEWKIASVIPLHKSGSLHDVKNYRPISILHSLSKVFEKLIHKHLYSYFETNNLLYNRNSGFRKYHSTTSNILEVTQTSRWQR